MAAIGQIRKHSGLLIGIVGAAMLLFVLGGALESSSVFISGPNDEIGEINGTKITYQDFELKLAQMEANSRGGLTEQEKQQMRDQIWNDILRSQIMGDEFTALGLSVSDEELMWMIKNDKNNPSLKQYFTDPQSGQIVSMYANPDGTLNGNAVIEYLKRVVYSDGENSAEALASWSNFQENYLRKPALDKKYATLLAKGIYITDAEIERSEKDDQSMVDFMYVASFYNDMPDEEVEVTDEDLKKYYNKHKSEPAYQQKELTSSINFVSFEVVPSAEDKEALKEELATLTEGFKNAESDTLFVNENSDQPFNFKWQKPGMFPIPFDTMISQGQVGDVFGPFENGNNFELVKVVTVKMGPDSVKASHILLPVEGDENAVMAQMDSIKAVVQTNNNFAEMASQYSKDPGSASQGGDLGWFTEGQMVPSFNDACFNGKAGDLVIVKSQFGIHLINIVEQTAPKEKVLTAVITNTIEPSQATYEQAYNEASTFAITNNDAEKFMEASEAMNRLEAPNLRPNDLTLMGRPNSRQIVRWVFESKVGEVSTPFETNNEFIVALVTEVKKEGILPLEMVEEQVRTEVIKEKKAAILMEKMDNPDIKKVAEINGKPIENVNMIPFSSFSVPGLGNEQKLLGMAFSLETGQTSKPIMGDRGVYVIMINTKNVPDQVNIEEGKRMGLMAGYQNRANFEPFNAMKANSEIVDNRYTFF